MNLKILSLVIIGVCILLPDVCYAFLSKDVHLLNMQNGLADNTVSAVYKDKEGFIWFGTRNGLSRYDGRRITNFERSRSYPSISNLKEVFDGVLAFVDNYNPQNHLAADNKTTCFIFPLKQKTKRLKKRSKQHTKSVIQMLFKSH